MLTIPQHLLTAANREYETRHRAKASANRDPLICGVEVVGFMSPHETIWGWRHGPIFVLPEFRRRGLVIAYYAAHPERACVAFVADTNSASRALHDRAGFVPWRRAQFGTYMRRGSIVAC